MKQNNVNFIVHFTKGLKLYKWIKFLFERWVVYTSYTLGGAIIGAVSELANNRLMRFFVGKLVHPRLKKYNFSSIERDTRINMWFSPDSFSKSSFFLSKLISVCDGLEYWSGLLYVDRTKSWRHHQHQYECAYITADHMKHCLSRFQL